MNTPYDVAQMYQMQLQHHQQLYQQQQLQQLQHHLQQQQQHALQQQRLQQQYADQASQLLMDQQGPCPPGICLFDRLLLHSLTLSRL